jgi:hypothetical protein
MVDRNVNLKKIADIKYYAAALYDEVTVSTGDTITPSDFNSTENLKTAVIRRNSDGSEITCTILLNVITVTTAALTNVECTVFVFGRRA